VSRTGSLRKTRAGIRESPADGLLILTAEIVTSVKVRTKENARELLGGKPLDGRVGQPCESIPFSTSQRIPRTASDTPARFTPSRTNHGCRWS
jgi:hypothetical protein